MESEKNKIQPIAIFGAPRSGTTWLGQLFNSSPNTLYRYQPLFSYEFKDYLNEFSKSNDINNFHYELTEASSEFVLTNIQFPKDKVTHLVWKEVRYHHITENLLKNSDIKVVYIKRTPIEVLNSWYQAPKEFNKEWDIQSEWRYAPSKNLNKAEEFNGFEKWLEVNKIHHNNKLNFPNKVHIVDYSYLKSDTVNCIKDIFDFCNLPYSKQTESFIIDSTNRHDNDSYSVYKSRNLDIKLPTNIINEIKNCKRAKAYFDNIHI